MEKALKKVLSILLITTMVFTSNSMFLLAEGVYNNESVESTNADETKNKVEESEDSSDETTNLDELLNEEQEEEEGKDEFEYSEELEDETETSEIETPEVYDATESKENELQETNESEITEEEETVFESYTEEEKNTVETDVEETTVEETTVEEKVLGYDVATESEIVDTDDTLESEKSEEDDILATASETKKVFDEILATDSEANLESKEGLSAEDLKNYLQNKNSNLLTVSDVYLLEDAVIDYDVTINSIKDININLQGHKLTFAKGFKFNDFKRDLKIVSDEKSDVVFEFGEEVGDSIPNQGKIFAFDNVNVIADSIDIKNINIEFSNCTFDIKGTGNALVNAVNSSLKIGGGLDVEGKSVGFVLDNSKMELTSANMKNNTVDTLFKVLNGSELIIKGEAVYEGNKNIYYVENSKLTVLDGSKYAKDTLINPPNREYTERIVTKKYTKLLDPDDDSNMNIVYRRNTGSYVIGVKNSEVEFDGVIVANEFEGTDVGAYVNLGSETSKLTLLNRAYVNQNTKNIVATSHDEFYGSKIYEDGSFDTLNRDATLSFYPTENGLTLLRDVIKRNENSLILKARDYKTDDEWDFLCEGFFYKACMIQNWTDDSYLAEPLPYGEDVVTCDIEQLGNGVEKGTFRLVPREERNVKVVFHLGEGVVPYVSFKTLNKETGEYDYEYDLKDTVEGLSYQPSKKHLISYKEAFKGDFNSVQPVWIDKTIPDEPYQYKFIGWSTTTDHLVTAPLTTADGKVKCMSIGYLEALDDGGWVKGADAILSKYGKFDYYDTIHLYACYQGDLKINFTFKAEERYLDPTVKYPIEKWEEKVIVGRSGHPFTLPTYVTPDDYIYDGFTVNGWQERGRVDSNTDYTITFLGEEYEQGQVITYVRNSSDAVDGDPAYFYAIFEGEEFDIYWYMNSEGIKEKSEHIIKGMNEDGFYYGGTKTKLGDRYSRLNPKLDDSVLSFEYVNYTLEDGVEFLGWTKQEIKKPLTDEELEDVVLVTDYLKGYSSREDSYYYPVLHYSPVVVEHDGNIALTQSYLNAQTELTTGTYELGTNVSVKEIKEIVGDVIIDLHGHELRFTAGTYFYGEGNLTFTDCKHDEEKANDRGSIYNASGAYYRGTGQLKFYQMTFRGELPHKFESLKEEVIIDDVELRENSFQGVIQNWYDDLFPRLMQIDNCTVNILNTHMDSIDGRIVIMNGGHLNLTNFTMTNCRRPTKADDDLIHIQAINNSKITVNAPCWFENNADIFNLDNSYLEIKSNATKFEGDLEAIKDEAVIFTENVFETIVHTKASDVRLSGIFYNNDTRLPIITEYSNGSKNTKVHFNGYTYVKCDRGEDVDSAYGGMGMFGNIDYIQNEDDYFDPNSEMEYYTFYWSTYFKCDPYACREFKILQNLTEEDVKEINKYRDENGFLKQFKLKNPQNGYTEFYYRPIIDGLYFDEDTGRGYSIVYNYENELDIIDINISNEVKGNDFIKFKDMDGNYVFDTIAQYDKNNPDKFWDWWNNLEFVSADSRKKFDGIYLYQPVTYRYEKDFNIKRANASMRLKILCTSVESPKNYYVTYDYKNRPTNRENESFANDKYDTVKVYGLKYGIDDKSGKNYSADDWYEVRGVTINNESSFPFTFEGWEYKDESGTYLLKPGEKYKMLKDFTPRSEYQLKAKWSPKQAPIVFKFNKYLKYNGIAQDYVKYATLGENATLIPPQSVEVDDRFTLEGWWIWQPGRVDPTSISVNGVLLGNNMWDSAKAVYQYVGNELLGSSMYINQSTEYVLYPIYYPKTTKILLNLVEEIKAAREKASASDAEKYITDAHTQYGQVFSYFFKSNNTITQNVCVGESVEVAAEITIQGDVKLDLHGNDMTITTGKFIIPAGSKLTLYNCKSSKAPVYSSSSMFSGDGEVEVQNLAFNIDKKVLVENANVKFSKCTFNNIDVEGDSFIDIINSKVTFDRMTFDGLAKNFNIDNSNVLLRGVNIKNSTADVLFDVKNNSKVDIAKYSNYDNYEFVNSFFENNKNIALVDNSKFMVTGGANIDSDDQTDIFYNYDLFKGRMATRNPGEGSYFTKDNLLLLDGQSVIGSNLLDTAKLERVVFRNNKGNYLFGAKNNAKIFFNGIAYKNNFTEDSNGKMGAYVNLGGSNTLILRNNPYINQNNRNIVVSDDDTITNDTDETEYQHGKAFSKNATLSFYLTTRKQQKIFMGTDDSWAVESSENPFGSDIYNFSIDSIIRENYLQPSCMIEGYRDNIFKNYGSSYAGNKMKLVFKQDDDNEGQKGFYAIPDETKDVINITFHGNGGTFRNFDNTATVSEITIEYNKLIENKEIDQYINNLIPVIYDDELQLEGRFRGWQYTKTWPEGSVRGLYVYDLIENTDDVDVYAIYDFPEIVYVTFRVQKGGGSNLKGQVYNGDFEEVTVKVLLNETYGLAGRITAPTFGNIKPRSGWNMGTRWVAENNNSYKYLVPGGEQRYVKDVRSNAPMTYYYIEFTSATSGTKSRSSSGGSGSSSGSSGGSLVGGPLGDSPVQGQQQGPGLSEEVQANNAQANQPAKPAPVVDATLTLNPTNNNPFAAQVSLDAFGNARSKTATEIGLEQMVKADSVIKEALANPNRQETKVNEASVKSTDAKWGFNAEGKMTLTVNSGSGETQIKDAWQKVEAADGTSGWYKFDANGNMQTGWVADGNSVYYFIESGANAGQMVSNVTLNIGGVEFTFVANGALQSMNGL